MRYTRNLEESIVEPLPSGKKFKLYSIFEIYAVQYIWI